MSYPRALDVGPISLHLLGLAIAAAIAVVGWRLLNESRRRGYDEDKFTTFLVWTVLGGIIGARLLFVVLNWGQYAADPTSILFLMQGGLSIHGAVLGGFIGAALYVRQSGMQLLPISDMVAPNLALGIAIGRVGCDIFGLPSQAPWAVQVAGQWLHPAQAYSILANYLIFVWLERVARRVRYPGEALVLFVAGYSGWRFLASFVRDTDFTGVFTLTQWASLPLLALALIYHFRQIRGLPQVAGAAEDMDDTPAGPAVWQHVVAVVGLLALYYLINAQQLPFARLMG